MKWISIAALLLGVLWRASLSDQLLLQFVVCAGAILVALQAAHAAEYFWAVGFSSVAVLYNPIVPVSLSGSMFLWLNLVCLTAFAVSLAVLRARPMPWRLLLAKSNTNPSSRVTTVSWS
jgi:hypothetical protein